jgi:glutamate-1-semialdehyde aminotransferase
MIEVRRVANRLGCAPYQALNGGVIAAEGPYLIATDGRRILDLGNCFGTVLLGHRDPDVSRAVAQAEAAGLPAGTANELVEEVGARLAEEFGEDYRTAFFMTGTTAVHAAVTIARAVTGRDLILSAGYHGWDPLWSPATSPLMPNAAGVIDFFYIASCLEQLIHEHRGRIACCIVSPDYVHLSAKALRQLFEICAEHRILVIADDVKYAYRLRNGVSIRALQLQADLHVMSKGIANGAPLSCVVGRAELMHAAREFSSTQTLYPPLYAAARATLDKLSRENVPARIEARGQEFLAAARDLLGTFDLPLAIAGRGCAFQLVAETDELEQSLHAGLLRENVFFERHDQWYVSDAFSGEVFGELLKRLQRTLEPLAPQFARLRGTPLSAEACLRAAWHQMDGIPDDGTPVEKHLAFLAARLA